MARDQNDIVVLGFGSWSDVNALPTLGFGSSTVVTGTRHICLVVPSASNVRVHATRTKVAPSSPTYLLPRCE